MSEDQPKGLCLSRTEIAEMTRTKMRKEQVAFFVQNGVRHYVDRHGWPVVLRSAVEGGPASTEPLKWKPNKAA